MEWLLLCVLEVEISIIDQEALCTGFFYPFSLQCIRLYCVKSHFFHILQTNIRSHPIIRSHIQHTLKRGFKCSKNKLLKVVWISYYSFSVTSISFTSKSMHAI